MKLGFIGTGIITSSLVNGFCKYGIEDKEIMVSPRNKEKAKLLADTYPDKVRIAACNQEIVDFAEWIFLAVLPKQAEDVLK